MIGWIWIVFGGYLTLRGLLDLVLLKVLGPVLPAIAGVAVERAPALDITSHLLHYGRWFYLAKSLFGAFAFVSAWRLLLMRRSARVAMQAVAWLHLAYVLAFAAFWSWLWPKVAEARAADPQFRSHSYAALGLVAGLAVCVVLISALTAQIRILRSGRVRAAFAAAAGPGQPSRE